MKREGYVYFLTNKQKNVLYIGVTADLRKRVWEHRNHIYKDSFTDKYNVVFLVYYEGHFGIEEAILREKQLKRWSRKKKDFLINQANPEWKDFYDEIMKDEYSLFDNY